MANTYLINTGNPRSITGHAVSGAFASGIISGSINYINYQNGHLNKSQALQNTLKVTVQGGIATSAAIAATNHLGPDGSGFLQAMTALSIGMAGIYAVEIADQALTNKLSKNKNTVETLETVDTDKTEQVEENGIASGE